MGYDSVGGSAADQKRHGFDMSQFPQLLGCVPKVSEAGGRLQWYSQLLRRSLDIDLKRGYYEVLVVCYHGLWKAARAPW
jgi:hypothetical protein